MNIRPAWFFFIYVLLIAAAANAQRSDIHVPAELESWRGWVLQDQEFRQCPFYFDRGAAERTDFICSWPGQLNLSVTGDVGRFSQPWTVYAEAQWIALPGNEVAWPQNVNVGSRSTEVVLRDGAPAVWLVPGQHTISGQFGWDERPRALAVPVQSGLIALTVDGERIEQPQRNRNALWLGEQQVEKKVEDAMKVEVYRLISDDIPTRLATVIKIEVAGSVREELIGPTLPDGFVPISIGSGLPARLEPDGNLRIQVRPGAWEVHLLARGSGVLNELTLPDPEHNLPATEIWSYQSNDTLRVTVAEAARPVDPNQVAVPDNWDQLPGFRIEPGESLTISERSRGKVETDNVLQLQRTLWMDFNGDGFVFADSVSGVMRSGWRLDMIAPYALLSAQEAGENLLVTQMEGNAGVELRQATVALEALGRADIRGEMPVTGWQSRIDSVSATLNLPPGHKLLAAPGVDDAPASWTSRWQLLDFFLLLIITIAAARLFGRIAGAVALVALTLSFHEAAAPIWSWLNLLVAVALVRVAPAGRLLQSMKAFRLASFALLLLVLIPFAVGQIRVALYPQLEEQAYYGVDADFGIVDRLSSADMAMEMPQSVVTPAPKVAREFADSIEEIVVTGAKRNYSRYAANALVQTGPGRPDWRWNSYRLGWSGPVDAEHGMRLIVLPDWLVSLLRFVAVTALGLIAALFAFDVIGKEWKWSLPGAIAKASGSAVFVAAMLVALQLVPDRIARADTPTPEILQQLEQRLLEPPSCAPRCAEVVSGSADIGEQALEISMTVHAVDQVAVPLPGSANGWRPEQILIGTTPATHVYRGANGVLWIRMQPGRHTLTLRGPIPPVDSLEIPFPASPRVIAAESDYWFIAGIQDRRLVSGSLNLTRLQQNSDGESTVRWESSRFPVFVRIERTLELDLDWRVRTQVYRVAPRQGALSINVPLLDGESIVSGEFKVAEGKVLVSMNPAQQSVAWSSTLPRQSPLSLRAAADQPWKEVWAFAIGSIWNVQFSGLPESQNAYDDADVRRAVFYPRPDEALVVNAGRPEATSGNTLAFDRVSVRTSVGARSRTTSLTLSYRSTRGAQHVIRLPENSDVTSVRIDNRMEPLRAVDDELSIPVLPGRHSVVVEWQNAAEPGFRERSPEVDLGASSSNIDVGLAIPSNRWILFANGPSLGPAILYWSELVVLIVFGLVLGRIDLTPLRTQHWILLGLGFSTFSWAALAIVVLWLLAHGARDKIMENEHTAWKYNVMQSIFALVSIVALLAIVVSLPQGLLGTPDMHVSGYQSYANSLSWFADRTESSMPVASVWSLPMWVYKVLILAWALWLSFALLRWLPWVWAAFVKGALWRSRKGKLENTASDPQHPEGD